ncbi:MAG TPA: hypothetical protein VGJ00_04130 [Rhabdochlamydiaceae bacterium]|jgi:hypothetical protein
MEITTLNPKPRISPNIDNPVVDILYRCYLEQRGRFIRHNEIPRDSQAMYRNDVANIVDIYNGPSGRWTVDDILSEFHLAEKARYVRPKFLLETYNM